MYVLYPRLIRHFLYITSTRHMEWMATHPWPLVPRITSHTYLGMAWWLEIIPDLGPHIGRSVAWMEGIFVYGLISWLVRPFPFIKKTCEKGGNPSKATDTSYHIPHISGNGLMVCNSYKIRSNSFGGLWHGGGHPHAYVIS